MVLLVDRRDDPVTPLLSQWTYQVCSHSFVSGGWWINGMIAIFANVTRPISTCQMQAMLHELLGIKDGTVVLDTPKVPEQYRCGCCVLDG